MQTRKLGIHGPTVSAIGLGCMGMSEFYGESNDQNSKELILKALELGVTMLDTADMYGNGHNEQLIAEALKGWSGEVFIATKFGIVRTPGEYMRSIDGRPEYVKKAVEASLRRLNRDVIDLYYAHRINPEIPIEDTVGAMADLVKEGKVRYIGLSEVSAKTIRRAHAVHPLTAIQTEYSLWTRDVEQEILPVTQELGIGFVSYSPLGRGFLTGKIEPNKMGAGDFRQYLPRLQGENYQKNQELTEKLRTIAEQKGVTSAQVCLAWVLSKGEQIVPIPGTRRLKYLLENIQAVAISLTQEEMSQLETLFEPTAVFGERYPEAGMVGINS